MFENNQFLSKILLSIRNEKQFNAKEWIDKKSDLFNDYMKSNKLEGCVVSVSGGIDSAVTYLLAKYAMNKPNSCIKQIIGICQPIKSTHSIWTRALELEDNQISGARLAVLDQSEAFEHLTYEVKNKILAIDNDYGQIFADGQLKSYMRTPVNYYVAQLLSASGCPAIVLGTGNKDEDKYLGYFCKAGDGVVDVQLISDLHKSEVFEVGRVLGVPKSILDAAPTADLWDGQTDEDEMGFSYDFIELLLEYHEMSDQDKIDFENGCKENGEWEYFTVKRDMAEKIHKKNKHKFNFPVNL